jgi:hypothetical protein
MMSVGSRMVNAELRFIDCNPTPIPQTGWKNPKVGTATALAVAALSGYVAIRSGDYRPLSGLLIALLAGSVTKIIHNELARPPETGMSPADFEKRLESELYSRYALKHDNIADATPIVMEKTTQIFKKISEKINEMHINSGEEVTYRLILPNNNWNSLTIYLELDGKKSEFVVGHRSFNNFFTINVDTLDLTVKGCVAESVARSKAKSKAI